MKHVQRGPGPNVWLKIEASVQQAISMSKIAYQGQKPFGDFTAAFNDDRGMQVPGFHRYGRDRNHNDENNGREVRTT